MAEGGQDGLQILADGLGTAGEIDDQGPVPNPGDRPGEHGPGRDGQGGQAHGFRDAGDHALTDGGGGLGGDVPGGEAGAAELIFRPSLPKYL